MKAPRFLVLTLAGALLSSGGALLALSQPQAAPASKGVMPKGRAPVSKEVLRVKLPAPAEADLLNGAHLMVLEDRRAPQVTVQIHIPGAGGYFDPAGMPGLASFTASQMREGTKQWTTTQLNEELERLAASVSVGAGVSSTDATLTASSLPEHLDRVLSIAADVLLNPTFPEAEFAGYKQRTRAGLMQQRANPDFLAQETANKVMFGNHPAARVSFPVESLDKATRADLAAFHQAKYVPDHAAIAISGDISMAEARKLVDAKFGAWKRANAPVPEAGDPPAPGPSQVHFVARPNSVQTNLIVTAPGISRTHRDYDVLGVMNQIIGGGPTGRLFIILREEKGYTYGAYSNVSAPLYRGTWSAATNVRTEVTEPALRDLMAEVARMRDERVPAEDFEAAKRNMVASFALGLESPGQVLSYHVTRWRYKLPMNYWDTQPQRIMAVTPEQVQAAAKQYLDPSKLQVVAVGDPTKVAEIMAKYGVVVKYDTEGRIVK